MPFHLYDHLARERAADDYAVADFRPRHDNIIVLPLAAVERAAGSRIITPDAHRERPAKGVVIAE